MRARGNKVDLVPATLDDKKNVYEWCFHSETTKSHSGPPDYPNVPVATWDEFYDNYHYQECFFTGAAPNMADINHGKLPLSIIAKK